METKISNKLNNVLNLLAQISTKSDMESKHGACIMQSGKIINTGFNHRDRSKIGNMNLPSIHAETDILCRFIKSNTKSRFVCSKSYRNSPLDSSQQCFEKRQQRARFAQKEKYRVL